jgi:imidazolonepropionase-like amidohydrolase
MRAILISILMLMAGGAAARAQETVVVRGRLIDGTGAAPVEDGVVIVRSGRIACAGRASECRAPAGARVIDAGGGTILPGLIDLHAHVWDRSMLTMFLPAGVTSVRDLHNTFENLAVLDTVTGPRPRLFRAGPLIDGRQAWPGSVVVRDEAGAAAAVDSVAARGVDFVKLYNGLSAAQVAAATARARERGKRVTIDLLGSQVDALTALEAGVEGFEHAGGFTQAYRRLGGDPEAALDSTRLDSLARAVVRHRAYLVPTLIVAHQYASEHRPELHGVPGADRVPDEVRAFWTRGDAAPATFKRVFSQHERFAMALTRRVAALGGRVGAGSDLPNPYVVPGGGLHQELELLVEAGLTPLQALRAATGGAADILGRGDLGVIAAGKAADLVVVEGNPAEEIRDTRRVRWVLKDGQVHAADALFALAPPVRGAAPATPLAPAAPPPDASRLAAGTVLYRVSVGADTTGADTLVWTRDGESFTAEQRMRSGVMAMSARVRLSLPALAPVESRSTQEMAGNRIEAALAYADGRVKGELVMPPSFGGTTALDAEAPAGTHDANALAPVVAALPLAEGAAWTVPVYTTFVRRVAPYRVEVKGVEEVATAMGPVRAWRVEVGAGAFRQLLWISEEAPRWLVASEIPSFNFRSVARARLP